MSPKTRNLDALFKCYGPFCGRN